MKAFAVIVPTAGYPEFDGNNYAALSDGMVARVIHTPGYPYAHVATYGAALRESADKRAGEVRDAIVLELNSPDGQWPGDAAIKAAIEKMLLDAAGVPEGGQVPPEAVEQVLALR